MDDETYQKTIRRMKRNDETTLCCVSCGESAPGAIELHHIYGRANSDERVPLCKNCHAKVTAEQNKFPPKSRTGVLYAALSITAFIVVLGQEMIDQIHEMNDAMNHDDKR